MKVRQKHKALVKGGILNKRWDLVAVNDKLECALEFKSILSSRFGKHYSSRVEEAIGVGVDSKSKNKKMKLGYLIVLQKDDNNSHKHHSKIQDFCHMISNEYKIYESAIAIEVSPNGFMYLFNNYESFINSFNYIPVWQKLFTYLKKDNV